MRGKVHSTRTPKKVAMLPKPKPGKTLQQIKDGKK